MISAASGSSLRDGGNAANAAKAAGEVKGDTKMGC